MTVTLTIKKQTNKNKKTILWISRSNTRFNSGTFLFKSYQRNQRVCKMARGKKKQNSIVWNKKKGSVGVKHLQEAYSNMCNTFLCFLSVSSICTAEQIWINAILCYHCVSYKKNYISVQLNKISALQNSVFLTSDLALYRGLVKKHRNIDLYKNK